MGFSAKNRTLACVHTHRCGMRYCCTPARKPSRKIKAEHESSKRTRTCSSYRQTSRRILVCAKPATGSTVQILYVRDSRSPRLKKPFISESKTRAVNLDVGGSRINPNVVPPITFTRSQDVLLLHPTTARSHGRVQFQPRHIEVRCLHRTKY